ncbi:MAG: hypothetical protein ABI834_11465 [Ginsengibacter sp.]
MSALSINKETSIDVRVLLIAKGTDDPITGDEYTVRLFDKNIYNEDFLGQSSLDKNGLAEFQLTKKHFAAFAKLDKKPDFYFIVYRNKKEIFESQVMKNLDLTDIEEFKMKEGDIIDLGTFLVEV